MRPLRAMRLRATRCRRTIVVSLISCALAVGCADLRPISGGDGGRGPRDASGRRDAGPFGLDGASADAAGVDAASVGLDAGRGDAGASALDAGRADAGGGALDGGRADAGGGPSPDAGVVVVVGDCISGAPGNRAVRFRWNGSGSGSTAYVGYEQNELPDTSRWRVGAYSMSIGYRPVFTDPFLGEGGLELSGTVFIDIELSTLGLGTVRSATIAIYGRSFNTTASGSFTWQTFSDTGAAPSGLVHNSAPYEWYLADATSALPAGDDGTLLRLRAGPPSSALVVNRVEICFD